MECINIVFWFLPPSVRPSAAHSTHSISSLVKTFFADRGAPGNNPLAWGGDAVNNIKWTSRIQAKPSSWAAHILKINVYNNENLLLPRCVLYGAQNK